MKEEVKTAERKHISGNKAMKGEVIPPLTYRTY